MLQSWPQLGDYVIVRYTGQWGEKAEGKEEALYLRNCKTEHKNKDFQKRIKTKIDRTLVS